MSHVVLPELTVIQTVADAMVGLTLAEKRRVASWLCEYVEDEPSELEMATGFADEAHDVPGVDLVVDAMEGDTQDEGPIYASFQDLYDAVSPRTGIQKVVAAAYWIEKFEGGESWQAFDANKLLKQIDVKISSISIVLTNGLKSKEPLIMMLSRNGEGSRSRKTFCLSEAGVAFVENRLG